MNTFLTAFTLIFLFGMLPSVYGWWVSTGFIRKAKKHDRCYYFRDGQRRTGSIIKKGFYKSYVRDVYDMKVRGVSNARIYPTQYQQSC